MTVATRLFAAAALLPILAAAAPAADLKHLDRTIAKEPAYASHHPQYCLLVFGPEAKTRVWLVADGDFLYVDRNGDGDLTGPGESMRFSAFDNAGWVGFSEARWVEVGEIREGSLKHERLRITQKRIEKGVAVKEPWEEELQALARGGKDVVVYHMSLSLEVRPRPGDPFRIAGRVSQWAGLDGEGFLQFADSPKQAPIIHFRGPMQMGLYAPQRLAVGGDASELQTVVGTPGLGKGTFASVEYGGLIADEAKPVADVTFPPAAPGSPPPPAEFTLPHRC
jgi:hypothetical protein